MRNLMIRPNRYNWMSDIDQLFDGFFNQPVAREGKSSSLTPRVNIEEGKDDIRMTFEIPGMDREDLKITVSDGVLTVSGKREFEQKSEESNWVRREMHTGEFSRSFTLPETVDPERVAADYKQGLLSVTIAKLEEVKPKEIEVKIS